MQNIIPNHIILNFGWWMWIIFLGTVLCGQLWEMIIKNFFGWFLIVHNTLEHKTVDLSLGHIKAQHNEYGVWVLLFKVNYSVTVFYQCLPHAQYNNACMLQSGAPKWTSTTFLLMMLMAVMPHPWPSCHHHQLQQWKVVVHIWGCFNWTGEKIIPLGWFHDFLTKHSSKKKAVWQKLKCFYIDIGVVFVHSKTIF